MQRIVATITVGLIALASLAAVVNAAAPRRTFSNESYHAASDSRSWDESATPANLTASITGASSPALECEGNACGQITLTFDETKQQYLAQNNSDRVVRVEASNWAGGRSVSVGAGKSAYLPLKSFVGPYRANYE